MYGMNEQALLEKWGNAEELNVNNIDDHFKKVCTAQILENIMREGERAKLLNEVASTVAPSSQATGQFQPITLALAQRAYPNLFAYNVVGLQPMSAPVGLAYAMRYYYKGTTTEAGFQSMPTYSGFSGSTSGTTGTADAGTGVATATAEAWQIGTDFPQLTVAMERVAIDAKARKLAANISLEAEMDIMAMHNYDIKKGVVDRLEYQIRAEKDREILARMKAASTNTGIGGETATAFVMSASDGRWQQERFSTVVNVIMKKARDVAASTLYAPANFVIVSNRVASALQGAGNQFNGNSANVNATQAIAEIGKLNGTISVYVDVYASSDYALVGYKGADRDNHGLIYSPYVIGLQAQATDPNDFSNKIGVMDRYAITDSLLGSGRYYRSINITGLDTYMGG